MGKRLEHIIYIMGTRKKKINFYLD